jgi:hypothetical protein
VVSVIPVAAAEERGCDPWEEGKRLWGEIDLRGDWPGMKTESIQDDPCCCLNRDRFTASLMWDRFRL